MVRPGGALLVLAALGCGGLFSDEVYTKGSGRELLEAVAHADRLPPHSTHVRAVVTTGPDRIINGEFTAPRADVEAWFETVQLPCDPLMGVHPTAAIRFFHVAGEASAWRSPAAVSWKAKHCADLGPPSTTTWVAITERGDPAWVWISDASY